ncbi:MAG: hypothetical protein GY830_07855 [Bacteroidetes bacterium]|nr:hypothetical protein [Bacteroidota bacterium]
MEKGKLTKLGIEGFSPSISPNGRYVSSFYDGNNLVIYDLRKKRIKSNIK